MEIKFDYCSQYERKSVDNITALPVTGKVEVKSDNILDILEEIFDRCNNVSEDHPSMFPNYPSMTSRDMVSIEDKFYLCCPIGWCEVTKEVATEWFDLSTNDLYDLAEESQILVGSNKIAIIP